MPLGVSLDDFDGITWTGSLLNIYDMTPSIIKQIELAKSLYTKKNKIFGSCWGLHVLVTAAGGKIRKNPNGLEAVVSKKITIPLIVNFDFRKFQPIQRTILYVFTCEHWT